ncbi:hypothetical protein A2716_02890 [candidate division WWE3 bacterium RIFCSPHIGHO2_01_FULL_40_23]|uniref:Uncharacterized protein n=1 Tax=candidate division WWE3 bacterium RIFCSPLOWO2_01_FULL_41_18 TaxID=1802625 RepID=A0A1F4VF98_UNCKA|nr:MAG: hypothetical protein A2716_02890 [candidate division WWE3 bacterium RIFCSPHIGHO2_01_FULL_40_23]OGC55932.1 MAG: hypothetical protein A3A78_02740 [candidate division WWE3 bacterium RIFCSPLOWO2_01_FULL_41_18]
MPEEHAERKAQVTLVTCAFPPPITVTWTLPFAVYQEVKVFPARFHAQAVLQVRNAAGSPAHHTATLAPERV